MKFVQANDIQAMTRGLHLGKGVMDNANDQFRDLPERTLTVQLLWKEQERAVVIRKSISL